MVSHAAGEKPIFALPYHSETVLVLVRLTVAFSRPSKIERSILPPAYFGILVIREDCFKVKNAVFNETLPNFVCMINK